MDDSSSAPSGPSAELQARYVMPVVKQTDAAPSQGAKEVWLVSRAVPDKEASDWKPITDAMTATANILWPLIAICALVLLREQIRQAAVALATRFADPNQNLKLGPLELSRRVNALESQIESSRVENQVLASAVAPIVNRATEADQDEALRELRALADQYKTVNIPDWGERVRAKDAIAARMANLVITRKIPRALLARDSDEGVRMALATVITTDPRPEDEKWIAIAAPGVQLKHVRYRFMMAIGRLAEFKLLPASRAREFEELAVEYRRNADESLLQRIDRTLQAIAPTATRTFDGTD